MVKIKSLLQHIITSLLTIGLVIFAVFAFKVSFLRTWEAIKDLGCSFGYAFNVLFLDKESYVGVTSFSKLITLDIILPFEFVEFKEMIINYGNLLFSSNGLLLYIKFLLNIFKYLPIFLVALITLVFVFVGFNALNKSKVNNDYGKETLALRLFKTVSTTVYMPIKKIVVSIINFFKANTFYLKFLLFVILLSFNILTIAIEAVAYYFYFCFSFDFANIYIQVCKLLMDIALMLSLAPIYIWIILAVVLFNNFRKKIALSRLNHFELMNRGYINSLSVSNMINGTMGKGKTTVMVDMAISQAVIFRDKAYELLLANDMYFPFFPWINLEMVIKKDIEVHNIYNLATCKMFADYLEKDFSINPRKDKLFGYDFHKYGLYYNNKLVVKSLFDCIKSYVQLYFIYIVNSSLIISNLAIRQDDILMSEGNFPIWNSNLLSRDTLFAEGYSNHSHILDFDSLRLGKKVIENNKFKDSFEFGVVCITEIGKERGNMLEHKGTKKTDETTNQLNDLFNTYIKMCRHSATVDNFPFIKFFCDEQRASSLGADARDLCTIINIEDKTERKLALPFFHLEEIIYNSIKPGFENTYKDYRFRRGDISLPMYLYKAVWSKIENYYSGIYNRYGYYKLCLANELGSQDGAVSKHNYFLMVKKIYSNRFSTDCFSDFFKVKALKSSFGINDIPVYENVKASFDELEQQNSYFVREINKFKDEE